MKTITKVALTCVLALSSLITTGCDTENASSHSVAVINAANYNSVEVDPSELANSVYECTYSYGSFSYIVVGENAELVYCEDFDLPTDNPSPTNKARRANTKAKEVAEAISTKIPKTEEVDMLDALTLGAKALSTYGNGEQTLIIFSTGLSTSGYVNMSDLSALENWNVAETLTQLEELNAIPEMTGITVYWNWIETAGEQKKISPAAQALLEEFWDSVITAGGGTVKFKDYLTTDSSACQGYPYVTPVTIATIDVPMPEEVKPSDITQEDNSIDEAIILGEHDVEFEANTAKLKDKEAALLTLQDVASLIIRSESSVLLISSTATVGSPESSVLLSEERGYVIRDLLSDLGVDSDHITVLGMGYSSDNPYYQYDLDINGNLLPSIASQNRKTVIVDAESDIAKQLLTQ